MQRIFLLILPVILFTGNIFSQTLHKDTLMLDGKVTRKQVEKYAWFKPAYRSYHPRPEVIAALKKSSKSVKVVLVIGSWCSDSKEHVPAFFKIADAIRLPKKAIEVIAVNRKKQSKLFDVGPLNVENVPTFIFYKAGEPIGSIVESPAKSIEEDLLQLLKAVK